MSFFADLVVLERRDTYRAAARYVRGQAEKDDAMARAIEKENAGLASWSPADRARHALAEERALALHRAADDLERKAREVSS